MSASPFQLPYHDEWQNKQDDVCRLGFRLKSAPVQSGEWTEATAAAVGREARGFAFIDDDRMHSQDLTYDIEPRVGQEK